MAIIIGTPGTSSRKIGSARYQTWKMMCFLGLGIVALFIILSLKMMTMKLSITYVVLFVGILYVLNRLERFMDQEEKLKRTEMKRAERGAIAEDEIGAILASLPDTYYVFNDLARVAGDIDHIVVGPTGLFVIETKAHGGKVTVQNGSLLVNGYPTEKNFLKQVWRNAFFIRDLLKNVLEIEIPMQPIVVFSNAFVKQQSVKGVTILNKSALRRRIEKGMPINAPIESIVALLTTKMGKGGYSALFMNT